MTGGRGTRAPTSATAATACATSWHATSPLLPRRAARAGPGRRAGQAQQPATRDLRAHRLDEMEQAEPSPRGRGGKCRETTNPAGNRAACFRGRRRRGHPDGGISAPFRPLLPLERATRDRPRGQGRGKGSGDALALTRQGKRPPGDDHEKDGKRLGAAGLAGNLGCAGLGASAFGEGRAVCGAGQGQGGPRQGGPRGGRAPLRTRRGPGPARLPQRARENVQHPQQPGRRVQDPRPFRPIRGTVSAVPGHPRGALREGPPRGRRQPEQPGEPVRGHGPLRAGRGPAPPRPGDPRGAAR